MLASEKFWSNLEILQVFEITLQEAVVLFVFLLDCKVLTFFLRITFCNLLSTFLSMVFFGP